MPISSMIVTSRGGCSSRVADRLRLLDGVSVTDIHGEELVVVMETGSMSDDRLLWDRVEATEDVLGVSLVYHNFEDEEKEAS